MLLKNKSNIIGTVALTVVALFATGKSAIAQEYVIPVAETNRTSPILFSPDVIKTGDNVYQQNCKSCHGDPGKANFARLDPLPVDPASSEFQSNTDGEIFYILRQGKGTMPSFASALSEMERWAVIAYIRSFNRTYVQPPLAEIVDLELTGTLALNIHAQPDSKSILVQLIDTLKGGQKPVANARVKLMVKRTFGNLNVSEETTDDKGNASFTVPTNLPGDSIGNLSLIAVAGSGGKEVSAKIDALLGVPTQPKQLLSQRAWWNVSAMAPVWLIATFALTLLAGLCTVAYVIFLLYQLKMANSNKKTEYERE